MRNLPLSLILVALTGCQTHQTTEALALEPRIVERGAFTAIGIQAWIDPKTADHEDIFDNHYRPHAAKAKAVATGPGFYGIYFASRGPGQTGYMVAVEAPPDTNAPEGLKALAIAPARYAVFEFPRAEIGKMWGYIHGEWLPNSTKYSLARAPVFEFYPKENTDETHLAIWIPIKAEQ